MRINLFLRFDSYNSVGCSKYKIMFKDNIKKEQKI